MRVCEVQQHAWQDASCVGYCAGVLCVCVCMCVSVSRRAAGKTRTCGSSRNCRSTPRRERRQERARRHLLVAWGDGGKERCTARKMGAPAAGPPGIIAGGGGGPRPYLVALLWKAGCRAGHVQPAPKIKLGSLGRQQQQPIAGCLAGGATGGEAAAKNEGGKSRVPRRSKITHSRVGK